MEKSRKLGDPATELESRAGEQQGRWVQFAVLDQDPDAPADGHAWIRRATGVLCIRVEGVTRTWAPA